MRPLSKQQQRPFVVPLARWGSKSSLSFTISSSVSEGGRMEWSLTGLPLPITLRPLSPLTDDELMAFSRKNRPFRIERNAKGEIEIMTPVGLEGGIREMLVARELAFWAEEQGGIAVGSNVGFNLPDGS